MRSATAAVGRFTAAADPLSAAMTQVSLGLAHTYRGHPAAAMAAYAAAEPVLLQAGSHSWLAILCNNRGHTCAALGDLPGAEASFAASIGHARQADDPRETANALDSLADFYRTQGRTEEARAALVAAQAELGRLPGETGSLGAAIAGKLGELGAGEQG